MTIIREGGRGEWGRGRMGETDKDREAQRGERGKETEREGKTKKRERGEKGRGDRGERGRGKIRRSTKQPVYESCSFFFVKVLIEPFGLQTSL